MHFGSLLRKEVLIWLKQPGLSSSWTWIHSHLSKCLFHKTLSASLHCHCQYHEHHHNQNLCNEIAEKWEPPNTSVVKEGRHCLSLQLALQVGQVVTWWWRCLYIHCIQFKNLSTVSCWKLSHQAFDWFKEILFLLLRFWRELKGTLQQENRLIEVCIGYHLPACSL